MSGLSADERRMLDVDQHITTTKPGAVIEWGWVIDGRTGQRSAAGPGGTRLTLARTIAALFPDVPVARIVDAVEASDR